MQIFTVEHAIRMLNECFYLSKEMVKIFSRNQNLHIHKISLHVEYQTAKQFQEGSTENNVQILFTKFKKATKKQKKGE